ncbi:MAG: hypothetical protein JXQ65_06000 [Candidatus Marinimicrobia bacterium]|nr:hypothetical protein [Candidatus Neomarinimicrobiota bacterium]
MPEKVRFYYDTMWNQGVFSENLRTPSFYNYSSLTGESSFKNNQEHGALMFNPVTSGDKLG